VEEMLKVKDVAKILGVTPYTVYTYINREENPLPAARLTDKCIIIHSRDLDAWIADLAGGSL